jgi:putative LysE/RhtB family amino acid efflux pump
VGAAFAEGFALGFVVAAQVGPIWLFCARSVLRGRFAIGLAIGAATAIVDASYGALGLAGAATLLRVDPLRIGLGAAGACLLAFMGLRTLWSAFRVRLGGETEDEVRSPARAFATALAATASNPPTIAYWAAVFSAASTAKLVSGHGQELVLLGGIGCGTFTWFVILSGGLTLARRRVGDRLLRIVDGISGTALLGFAGLLGWRVARS